MSRLIRLLSFCWLAGAFALSGAEAAAAPKKKKKKQDDAAQSDVNLGDPGSTPPVPLKNYWYRPSAELAYENFKVYGNGETIKATGFGLKLPFQVDWVIIPYVLHGLGEAGFGFAFDNGDSFINGENVKFKFNPVYLTFGGGVSYLATKALQLEFTMNYDIGITGSAEAKSSYGTTGYDIESFRRLHFAPGMRIDLTPDWSIGGRLSFYSGSIQLKDLNEGEVADPLKQKGYQVVVFGGLEL